MKARALPKSLTDCLVPNDAALTIMAAVDLIVKNMLALHGEYRDFHATVNHEVGFIIIQGMEKSTGSRDIRSGP